MVESWSGRRSIQRGVEPLETRLVLDGGPLITELMATNGSGLADESGEFPDWIEIHNPTGDAIDLGGWHLTDRSGNLTKWEFPSTDKIPSVAMEPGGYLIVFASGNDVSYDDAIRVRDFHTVRDATFLVDLPDGDYDVALTMGDRLTERQDVALSVQGEEVERGIVTRAGELATRTYRASVSAATNGQMAIRLVDTSSGTGIDGGRRGVINALEIVEVSPGTGTPPMRFDFGTVDSPVDTDYLQVIPEATYTAESGYGWNKLHAGAVDRGVRDLHANFKLSSQGEFLALVDADGETIHHQYAPEFPPQEGFVSYGLGADMVSQLFFTVPTPGEPNGQGVIGLVDPPTIHVDGGFFDAPFDVEIATDEPGVVEIRYTTNGSMPTPTTGILYDGPIHVDHTTTLRAISVKPDHASIDAATRSYLFIEDVLTQPNDPEGFPTEWMLSSGSTDPAVYRVIPEKVDLNRETILDDLKSLPTLSLVMEVDDMFGDGGVYNSGQDNIDRAVSVEWLDPNGETAFQIDAAVRLQGGASRLPGVQKRNLRLRFTSEFGPEQLVFPFFDDSSLVNYSSIVLRHSGGQLIKDEFSRRTQLATGSVAVHGRFMHVYINGLYWGIYDTTERPDSDFAAEHLGGSPDDWDNFNRGQLRDGDMEAWNAMLALVPAGITELQGLDETEINDRYEALRDEFVDMEQFIDYIFIGLYLGTTDWLPNNYWAARRSRDGDGPVDLDDPAARFQFIHWDQEDALKDSLTFKIPGFNSPVGRLLHLLRSNDEFRELNAQRIYEHLFHGGALSEEAVTARYQSLVDDVEDAVRAEGIRWGTDESAWHAEAQRIMEEFFPNRRDPLIDTFRSLGLYPETDAPVFSQQGGPLSPGETLDVSAAAGAVYYTLDGSDPRLSDGSISPGALLVDGPISFDHDAILRARALVGDEWSVLNQAEFIVGSAPPVGAVAITEIHYHPTGPTPSELGIDRTFVSDDFEFVEIYNTTDEAIDLSGARWSEGIEFDFSNVEPSADRQLDPGEYAVVVADTEAFEVRYGAIGARILGQYAGRLNNGGEPLRLEGPFGALWHDFRFDDGGNWPSRADGQGSSLELIGASTTGPAGYGDSRSWRASVAMGGSPGSAGRDPFGVVINEVLARSGSSEDAVELFNGTNDPVDVGGWYLSDSRTNLLKFRIPDGTVILADDYLRFDESDLGFSLRGSQGDDVWLVTTDSTGLVDALVDDVAFGAADINVSWGRWPNGHGRLVPMSHVTLGQENSGPRFGSMVISELMVAPVGPHQDGLEFVELYNASDSTIDVSGWKIREAVDFNLPEGTTIEADGTIVVVTFDPTDPQDAGLRNLFQGAYGIDRSVPLVGGFSGRLSSEGEAIELLTPDGLPIDVFAYDDAAPWPTKLAGTGDSIHRLDGEAWGGDGDSWTAAAPTPGSVDFSGTPLVGDMNRSGAIDLDDIPAFVLALTDPEGYELHFGVPDSIHGDVDGDGDVDFDDIGPFTQLHQTPTVAAQSRSAVESTSDPVHVDAVFAGWDSSPSFRPSYRVHDGSDG